MTDTPAALGFRMPAEWEKQQAVWIAYPHNPETWPGLMSSVRKTFLEYYRGELMQAHNEWKECQKSVLQVVRDEPDLAADYIAEINNRLAQKGIRPVKLPPKLKEQLGIED